MKTVEQQKELSWAAHIALLGVVDLALLQISGSRARRRLRDTPIAYDVRLKKWAEIDVKNHDPHGYMAIKLCDELRCFALNNLMSTSGEDEASLDWKGVELMSAFI